MSAMDGDQRTAGSSLAWTAVVVNWNGAGDLPNCIAALRSQDHPPVDVLIVDNASTDTSLAVLRDLTPSVSVVASGTNLGFAGGANAGIRASATPLVAVLNPDVTVAPTWASRLLNTFAADERLGAAGGKLLFPGGETVQHAGGTLDPVSLVAANVGRGERDDGQYDSAREVDFLTGAALMLRRAAFDRVGGFDEAFHPAYYEDVDLCVRLRNAGWGVRYVPDAEGLHRESASVDGASAAYYRLIHAGRLRYAARHLAPADLLHRFLPAEARRLSEAALFAREPWTSDQSGWSVFPSALTAMPTSVTQAAEPSPLDPAGLSDQVSEVGRRWLVQERPFQSGVRVAGRAIAWLRSRVNDLGPRWHVRAILAQQVEFNAAVFRALRSTAIEAQAGRLQADAQTAILYDRLDRLAADQRRLSDRLADLEARLGSLSIGKEP